MGAGPGRLPAGDPQGRRAEGRRRGGISGVLAGVVARWDAVSADFRRFYHVDLGRAYDEWPAAELAAKVKALPADSALARAELGDAWDYNDLAANLAMLVDLMSYWLHNEYARWTADPDEVKRGPKVKPPPIPLIPPVAHRPASVAAAHAEQFAELAAQFGQGERPSARERARTRWATSDEVDVLIDAL